MCPSLSYLSQINLLPADGVYLGSAALSNSRRGSIVVARLRDGLQSFAFSSAESEQEDSNGKRPFTKSAPQRLTLFVGGSPERRQLLRYHKRVRRCFY